MVWCGRCGAAWYNVVWSEKCYILFMSVIQVEEEEEEEEEEGHGGRDR